MYTECRPMYFVFYISSVLMFSSEFFVLLLFSPDDVLFRMFIIQYVIGSGMKSTE